MKILGIAALVLSAALSGCASLRLHVSNPHRDNLLDVTANGTPVVTGLATGYASADVRPVSGRMLEIEATSYTVSGSARRILDWFKMTFALDRDRDLNIRVGKDGELLTTGHDRE